MNLNRRGFITGLIASIATPAIVKPSTISMRMITEYVPTNIAQIDVLYGSKLINDRFKLFSNMD